MTSRYAAACVLGMVLGASGFAAAADLAPPADWVLFGPVPPAEGRPIPDRAVLEAARPALTRLPEALEIGGTRYPGQPVSLDPTGLLDLGARFGNLPRGALAFLAAPLRADGDATLRIGTGANWWMQWWLDGTPLFDTLSGGNGHTPITAANHAIERALPAGEHILAVAVIAGSGGLQFAAGKPGAAYTDLMAQGRALHAKLLRLEGNAAMAARSREAFQKAADCADGEYQKAYALLALGDSYRADPNATDYAAIRDIYDQVRSLAEPIENVRNRKGDASIAIAETWLLERDFARARDEAARALSYSSHPHVVRPARHLAAVACLREGRPDEARAELRKALAMDMPDWVKDDQRRQWREETEALLEQVDDVEAWRQGARPAAPAAGRAARGPRAPLPFLDVVRLMRRDRPRLFLNREMLDRARREGLSAPQQAWLAELKEGVDRYPDPPALDDAQIARLLGPADTSQTHAIVAGDWGFYAAHAALVWRLTGDRATFERAAAFLEHAAGVWDAIYRVRRMVSERIFQRLNALSAYDWLYDDLPEARRRAIGRLLFPALNGFYMATRDLWANRDPRDPTRYQIGYSDAVMGWYLGLGLLGAEIEGLEDDVGVGMLRDGYQRHVKFFDIVESYPDGVIHRGAIGYFVQGVDCMVNFLDGYRAAIPGDIARAIPNQAVGTVHYLLWNTIAPTRERPLTHGWGDKYHINNELGGFRSWLMRTADLYAGLGDQVDLEALTAVAQFQMAPDYRTFLTKENYQTPAAPLLMSWRTLPENVVAATIRRLPRARHFPDPIGQTFMNSGWGEDDTYALFIAGRQFMFRKHYDENHFTIYKKGFLAMDTGARPAGVNPAVDGDAAYGHDVNYYYDTVAHNGVLITMEGEQLPGYWGKKAEVNTGGMNKNYGARVQAFETDGLYTYVASDATSCYHSNKAAEVVRQFLFVYPDYFAVFDRVESKTPDQKKTWLFHTQMEPVETGDTFRAEHREGAVCVRTLLPRDRVSAKIGGPGKEFWADGRNWPVADTRARLMVGPDGAPTPARHLYGQWRMEISAEQDKTRERFLHLIQAGERAALTTMTGSRLIEEEGRAGIEFEAGALSVRVLFTADGAVGGHIRIADGSRVLADRPLTRAVQPQTDLALIQ